MSALSKVEQAAVERVEASPMLEQLSRWAEVNSGTTNLSGLKVVTGMLADAFSGLPGDVTLVDPDPVEQVDANGKLETIQRGRTSTQSDGIELQVTTQRSGSRVKTKTTIKINFRETEERN